MNEILNRLSGEYILGRATELVPTIRSMASSIDNDGAIPQDLIKAMQGAGIFRMTAPRSWGGPELDPMMQFRILEILSAADGSTGWCAYTGATSGYFASCLDPQIARDLYSDIDVITAGTPAPAGTAIPVEGGYRISGRWSFGSGICAATWIVGGCMVEPREGDPHLGKEREYILAFLSQDDVTIIENWNTIGLRGTGSHDYAVNDAFVPKDRTFNLFTSPLQEQGPTFRLRNAILFNHAAVILGIARGAIEDFITYATAKQTASGPLANEAYAAVALAKADAMVGAGKSYCLSVMREMLDTLTRGDQPTLTQRARYRGAITFAHEMATQAVDLLFHTAGASVARIPNDLERAFRDVHVGNQHQVASPKSHQFVGAMLFGRDPGDPLF